MEQNPNKNTTQEQTKTQNLMASSFGKLAVRLGLAIPLVLTACSAAETEPVVAPEPAAQQDDTVAYAQLINTDIVQSIMVSTQKPAETLEKIEPTPTPEPTQEAEIPPEVSPTDTRPAEPEKRYDEYGQECYDDSNHPEFELIEAANQPHTPRFSVEDALEAIENNPSMTRPRGMVNLYLRENGLIDEDTEKTESSEVAYIYLETDKGGEVWNKSPAPGEDPYKPSTEQTERLLLAVDAVVQEINKRPKGFWNDFGVDYVYIILNNEGSTEAGGYSKEGRLLIIHLNNIDEQETDLDLISELMTHEGGVGHALDEAFCDVYKDLDITFEGIDFVEDRSYHEITDQEMRDFWSSYDESSYTEGPGMIFARGVVEKTITTEIEGREIVEDKLVGHGPTEKEYYAELMTYTFETHGLILEGDLAFGSLLQENQYEALRGTVNVFSDAWEYSLQIRNERLVGELAEAA